jgi:acyl-CoA synthetase (NDP forming)
MKDEVLSHYKEPNIPKIDGFLVAEPISFTMSLGNEILIGIKDDPSFGPVATLSKGGDDAEFFARYYDPANLILPPVEYEEVYNIVYSLKIRNKYESQKHYDYIELLSEALYRICKLAYQYSFISKHKPKYIIKTMDINPFVFSENGSLIAVDGFAEFRTFEECGITHSKPNVESLKGFFDPKGIVVSGVSSDARKYSLARNIVQLLADMGRTDIYCTNPKGGEAVVNNRTYHLYRSLSEVPDRYDLVVWAAPAQHTLDFIATIPDNKSVVLISGLPGDIKYSDFILAINKHKERGLRFVGPNCMGVYYAPDARHEGIDTLFIGEERLKLGYNEHSNTALFSQSGGMAISSIERTQNSPIYKVIVSFGNKVDVNVPDLLRYFARDPLIDVIAMYIEGLGDGEGHR